MEAFMAILLLTGFLVVFHTTDIGFDGDRRAREITSIQRSILEEIATDGSLRESLLDIDIDNGYENDGNFTVIEDFVKSRVPEGFNFSISVCSPEAICGIRTGWPEGDVYSSERIISSTLEKYNPRKIRIFMWREWSKIKFCEIKNWEIEGRIEDWTCRFDNFFEFLLYKYLLK